MVLYATHPGVANYVLHAIREREPERPIICIFEDLDILINAYGDSEFLKLLDGEYKVDNVVYIATTNYLNQIHKRIRSRPSRFDEVIEIPMPMQETREAYLRHLLSIDKLDEKQLTEWVDQTDGLSIAHLKELFISVKVLDNTLEESLKRLRELGAVDLNDEEEDDD